MDTIALPAAITAVPFDVLCEEILCYLTGKELAAAAQTCKEWKDATDEANTVWRSLCVRDWKNKAEMPFSYDGAREDLFHRAILSKDGIGKLGIKEMKKLLVNRGINFSKFIEKKEFKEGVLRTNPMEVSKTKTNNQYCVRTPFYHTETLEFFLSLTA